MSLQMEWKTLWTIGVLYLWVLSGYFVFSQHRIDIGLPLAIVPVAVNLIAHGIANG